MKAKAVSVWFVLAILASFSMCSTGGLVEKPRATINSFEIESISLKDAVFLLDIGITNPYPLGIELRDVAMKLNVEGKELLKTSTGQGLKVPAKGSAPVIQKISLKYADVMKVVKDYEAKEYLDCTASVTVVIPLPKDLGVEDSITFNYNLNARVPAVKPDISIEKLTIQKPDLKDVKDALTKGGKKANANQVVKMFGDMVSGKKNVKKIIDPKEVDLKIKISYNIVMENKTRATMAFTDLNYVFSMGADKLMEGKTAAIKNEGQKNTITVAGEFSSAALTDAVLDMISKKKGKFSLKGSTMIKFPDTIKKEPLKLDFDEAGDFAIK